MSGHLSEEQATYIAYDMATPEERREAELHRAGCADCAALVQRFAKERPRVVGALKAVDAPAGLEERIRANVKPARRFTAWFVAAAAVLVFAATAMLVLGRPVPTALTGPVAVRLDGIEVDLETAGEMVLRGRHVTLSRGHARFRVQPGEFTVSTPVADVTVVGTDFTVDVWQEGDEMNRKVLVGAPMVAGVAVIAGVVLFHNDLGEARVSAGEAAIAVAGKAPVKIDPKDYAKKAVEIESLKAELAAAQKRAEAAEAAVKAASTPKDPVKPVDPKPADWKKVRTPEFEAKVKAIAWNKQVHTLRSYWEELEASRREGRPPVVGAVLGSQLNAITQCATELAKELGLGAERTYDVYQNELVGQAWMDAMIGDLAGDALSAGQLDALHSSKLYAEDDGVKEDGRLGAFRRGFEHNLTLVTATRDILTPEQYERLSKTVSPDFMMSIYSQYQPAPIQAATPEAAGGTVAQYWTKNLKLPEGSAAAVDAIALDYARQVESVMATTGGSLTREQDAALKIRLIDLQIAAEKRLADGLGLDEEARQRVLKGSPGAIWIQFAR